MPVKSPSVVTPHPIQWRKEWRKFCPKGKWDGVIALEFGLCNGRARSRSFWEGYQLSTFSGNYPLPRSTVCPVTRGAATIQRDTMSGIKGPAFWPQLRRPLQLPPPLWDAQQPDFSPGPAHKLSASFPGPPTCNSQSKRRAIWDDCAWAFAYSLRVRDIGT